MPEPTPVEREAVDNYLKKADMLTNGKRGDVDHLCEVMRDFAHLFVTSISSGGVTPVECRLNMAEHNAELDMIREAIKTSRKPLLTTGAAWGLAASVATVCLTVLIKG